MLFTVLCCALSCSDNHGSGYLGMARWFNVHRRLPAQLKLSYLSSEKDLAKTIDSGEGGGWEIPDLHTAHPLFGLNFMQLNISFFAAFFLWWKG